MRIAAWQIPLHAERARQLGPNYHCPTCTREEKDIQTGDILRDCDGRTLYLLDGRVLKIQACELTRERRQVREEIKREVIRRYSKERLYLIWPWPFSVEWLLKLHGELAGKMEEAGRKIKAVWDETEAGLCSVIESERFRSLETQRWHADQKAKQVYGGHD